MTRITNDLRIVPSVATDEMVEATLYRTFIDENDDMICLSDILYCDSNSDPIVASAIKAALSAAPDYSHLVIVEKSMLKQVLQALRDLRAKPIDWEYSQGEQLLITQIKDILNDK